MVTENIWNNSLIYTILKLYRSILLLFTGVYPDPPEDVSLEDWRITWNKPEMSEVQRVSHYVLQCHPVCYITNPIIKKGNITASYNYLFVSILFQPKTQQDNSIYCSWLNKILALQHVMLHNQLFNMRSMFQHNLVNSAQDSGQ